MPASVRPSSFAPRHSPPPPPPPPCCAETNDTTVFNALTLLVVLGTSLITQIAGLSLALGAFLAGLLLAETEYHLQVCVVAGSKRGVRGVAALGRWCRGEGGAEGRGAGGLHVGMQPRCALGQAGTRVGAHAYMYACMLQGCIRALGMLATADPFPAPPAPLPGAQVESDIGPYKGLLMGLFFMTGGLGGAGGWCRYTGRAPRACRHACFLSRILGLHPPSHMPNDCLPSPRVATLPAPD